MTAIFLALNSVLGTLFSTENSLFIHLRKRIFLNSYYYPINIVNIMILNFFSKNIQLN